jgi:organic hydroperoxide reductase OsmC/OhrA
MAARTHRYRARVTWTGNRGSGTSGYREYDRHHEISADSKPALPGSADPAFRGDAARWNPEELLVASLSACHQLWYLHLCADAGIRVLTYVDDAEGELQEGGAGGGRFVRATLRPKVTVARGADVAAARALHAQAHTLCFVANSVNFPVSHEAEVTEAD